jgi:hypothetical protein
MKQAPQVSTHLVRRMCSSRWRRRHWLLRADSAGGDTITGAMWRTWRAGTWGGRRNSAWGARPSRQWRTVSTSCIGHGAPMLHFLWSRRREMSTPPIINDLGGRQRQIIWQQPTSLWCHYPGAGIALQKPLIATGGGLVGKTCSQLLPSGRRRGAHNCRRSLRHYGVAASERKRAAKSR